VKLPFWKKTPALQSIPAICFDCGKETLAYEMQTRQLSQGDGVIFEPDFGVVPVHVNRRECHAAKKNWLSRTSSQR
jgi:hypothetical protein